MDYKLFQRLWKEGTPCQKKEEWYIFLEYIINFFQIRKIKNPRIVEIGCGWGNQEKFYRELLNAHYVGIDNFNYLEVVSSNRIYGDSHDSITIEKLKNILNKQQIDLLFIDADHSYHAVKTDFELYNPLVKHIVAFHDISINSPLYGVKRFWNEIKGCKLSIIDNSFPTVGQPIGIGILIKEF